MATTTKAADSADRTEPTPQEAAEQLRAANERMDRLRERNEDRNETPPTGEELQAAGMAIEEAQNAVRRAEAIAAQDAEEQRLAGLQAVRDRYAELGTGDSAAEDYQAMIRYGIAFLSKLGARNSQIEPLVTEARQHGAPKVGPTDPPPGPEHKGLGWREPGMSNNSHSLLINGRARAKMSEDELFRAALAQIARGCGQSPAVLGTIAPSGALADPVEYVKAAW